MTNGFPTVPDEYRPHTYWPEGDDGAHGYGRFLEELLPGECEILRIQMMSVMSDVISFRARKDPEDGMIHYRMVDEYEGFYGLPWTTSLQPLSRSEVIQMIDGVNGGADGGVILGLVNSCLHPGCDTEALRYFVEIESRFYFGLGQHYSAEISQLIDRWEEDDEDDQFLFI